MQGRRCWALGFDPIRENLRRSNPVRVIINLNFLTILTNEFIFFFLVMITFNLFFTCNNLIKIFTKF